MLPSIQANIDRCSRDAFCIQINETPDCYDVMCVKNTKYTSFNCPASKKKRKILPCENITGDISDLSEQKGL